MNLDLTKFGELNRCLTIFKDLCNDVEIRNGFIRQKTNDGSVVFEIDLTSLLGDLNIRFSNLKEKLDLFKVFYNSLKIYQKCNPWLLPLYLSAGGALFFQIFNTSYYKGKVWLPITLCLVAISLLEKYYAKKSEQSGK